MTTFDDIARLALALPETTEGVRFGGRVWRVREKAFVWERPLRAKDWAALEREPNSDPVFCVSVADVPDKLAHIDAEPDVFFETPHFVGFPAVLVWLDRIQHDRLEEVITDGWITNAPKRLAQQFLDDLSK